MVRRNTAPACIPSACLADRDTGPDQRIFRVRHIGLQPVFHRKKGEVGVVGVLVSAYMSIISIMLNSVLNVIKDLAHSRTKLITMALYQPECCGAITPWHHRSALHAHDGWMLGVGIFHTHSHSPHALTRFTRFTRCVWKRAETA